MKRLIAVLPLVLTVACTRPEVEAFRKSPEPIVVSFQVPDSVPGKSEVAKEYAAALRARLAMRATVVPAGVPAPHQAAELRVRITGWREVQKGPSPGAVGAITGVAVGAISALAGNRDAAFDGFYWGMWAGSHAAAERDREARLGFRPQRVEAQVAVYRAGDPEPLMAFAVEPYEVIDAMDPLGRGDRDDQFRIREEEAKALARVIVFKIQEKFQWRPLPEPSWYGEKPRLVEEDDDAPAPDAPVKPE